MPFSFTFKLAVPGLINPFATPSPPVPRPVEPNSAPAQRQANFPRRRPSPLPSAGQSSRKRGWEPAFADPSLSATTVASASGYLDTPAKYRQMSGNASAEASIENVHTDDAGVFSHLANSQGTPHRFHEANQHARNACSIIFI